MISKILRTKSTVLERTLTCNEKSEYFPKPEFEPHPMLILLPENWPKVAWDFLTTAIVLYQSFIYPVYFAFGMVHEAYYILDISFTAIFFADIIINFNCAFYSRGALVTDRKAIALRYLKFWLWIDLISTFPYTWAIDGNLELNDGTERDTGTSNHSILSSPPLLRALKITRVMSLIRLTKFRRKLREFEYLLSSSELSTYIMAFRLLVMMVIVSHWIACLWIYVSFGDYTNEQNWLVNSGLEDETYMNIYITAMYWAIASMASVGYGDIKAANIGEKILSIVCIVIGSGIFTFIISSIGALISKQAADSKIHRESVVKFNSFMKYNDIPQDLKFKVRRYLDYVWEKREARILQENDFLNLLSSPLRDAIFFHTRGVVLKECSVLSELCTGQLLLQITRIFEPKVYAPSDVIFEQEERSIYLHFIIQGLVEILHKNTKTVFANLSKGLYFGEISFFTFAPRKASARCLEFVETLALSRRRVDELAEVHLELANSLENIRRRCEEADLAGIQVICYMCFMLGHAATDCKRFVLNANADENKGNWLKMRARKTMLINPYSLTQEKNYTRKVHMFNALQAMQATTKRITLRKQYASSDRHFAFNTEISLAQPGTKPTSSPEENLRTRLEVILSEEDESSEEERLFKAEFPGRDRI